MPQTQAVSRRSFCRAVAAAGGSSLVMPLARAASPPIRIVAAENFYGDVARQIGGNAVVVTSILSNPDEDPHLFEADPRVARALAGARIAIENGVGYDPWMQRLLTGMAARDRVIIDVGVLTGHRPGANPHIWYDIDTMVRLAQRLAAVLTRIEPAEKAGFAARRAAFEHSLMPIKARIAALRKHLAGTVVTATEPVFGYMFSALGMTVVNQGFQLAVMNNTEPSPQQVARFEQSLDRHDVKLLAYNSQASDPMAARMMRLARRQGIPVIGVTETEPPSLTYQRWMQHDLNVVAKALTR